MSTTTKPKLTLPVGERDHWLGAPDASIVFVEYGDFECPHCKQAHSIVREVLDDLGDRVHYVFRHFPLASIHPSAQKMAEAAEAAAAQGKYWEMHDLLFAQNLQLDEQGLVNCAEELGLDVERFGRDLREGVYAERVREDFLSGVHSGVNGTPTFFISGERYDGPWDVETLKAEIERPLGIQIRNVFQTFTGLQASGGIVLLLMTILALVWANSPWADSYFHFWETDLSIRLGSLSLTEHLLEWVNDGLMVVFFFVVGLEIKREILIGELSSARKAILPIMAALGGMVVPGLLYLVFNAGGPGQGGWAIPVATDIAFTLGLLTLLGRRIPLALKVFFTAMAIADDLGAVLVIAMFYTSEIHWVALGIGALILAFLVVLNRVGVRHPLPYGLFGIALWLAFLESGIHPTIAGVLLALTIPARTLPRREAFLAQCIAVLGDFRAVGPDGEDLPMSDRQQAGAITLESIAERMQTPAQRLERTLTPWATYLILPLFALGNAGVDLSGDLGAALTSPISLGIIFGLVLGKAIGLSLFTWLAVKLGIAEMPARVSWPQLLSSTWLAGIGFTMSLFITNSAFSDPAQINAAKIGILAASLLAGILGFAFLSLTSRARDRVSPMQPEMAAG